MKRGLRHGRSGYTTYMCASAVGLQSGGELADSREILGSERDKSQSNRRYACSYSGGEEQTFTRLMNGCGVRLLFLHGGPGSTDVAGQREDAKPEAGLQYLDAAGIKGNRRKKQADS
jgi:hypothetical protein